MSALGGEGIEALAGCVAAKLGLGAAIGGDLLWAFSDRLAEGAKAGDWVGLRGYAGC